MTDHLPTLAEAKSKARTLRADLSDRGLKISHSDALERMARVCGFRDWNTLHATIKTSIPVNWSPGGRVHGRYLSQKFSAKLVSVEPLQSGWYRLALDLDEAVDVVTFVSFTNFRRRISGVIGLAGVSRERTSDGVPQLQLDMSRRNEGAAK